MNVPIKNNKELGQYSRLLDYVSADVRRIAGKLPLCIKQKITVEFCDIDKQVSINIFLMGLLEYCIEVKKSAKAFLNELKKIYHARYSSYTLGEAIEKQYDWQDKEWAIQNGIKGDHYYFEGEIQIIGMEVIAIYNEGALDELKEQVKTP